MATKKKTTTKKKTSKKAARRSAHPKTKNSQTNKQQTTKIPSEQQVPLKVKKVESKQLTWFFFWIALAFASFLIPYLFMESSKSFEYHSIDWLIEEYGDTNIYHGRFKALDSSGVNFNLYLRNDPRENEVSTQGEFHNFKVGGYVSFSPEIDACRGEVSRVMLDLGSFLKAGIGVQEIGIASTDTAHAKELGRLFMDCSNRRDRTVVIIKKGPPRVEQSPENKYCYTIYVEDCNDVAPVEKFMVTSVHDFRARYPLTTETEVTEV